MSAIRDCGGAATVDWVVLTSAVTVAGIVTVYFLLGSDGGFLGMVDTMTSEVNQAADNISGVAEQRAPSAPGDGGPGGD